MSSSDLAKNFEQKFKKDWMKTFPDGLCFRLADQMSGYKNVSQNPSDFICYNYPRMFFCELKTHKGASIPFDAIPQYDRLIKYDSVKGIFCGIIIWLYEKDVVVYLPVKTITRMKEDGLKSFGVKHLEDTKYKSIIIPSIKKRVFMDSDYSILMDLEDGD